MHGEFIGVWSEMWREIWLPLINEPFSENEVGIPEDIFCELYQDLTKALKKPSDNDAIVLLLEDAIALREAFEHALQRAGQEPELKLVDLVFRESGATELLDSSERRIAIEAALTSLLEQPAGYYLDVHRLLDAQLLDLVQDASRVEAARQRTIERIVNNPDKSREAFENTRSEDLKGERALVGFLESTFYTLEDLGGDELTNHYFNLLVAFIEKFSLRYDLRRPCVICPTLPGIFASLVHDLRLLTSTDPYLDAPMKEFENEVRLLRFDCTDGHIKTCIHKQVNLLEALGQRYPGVTRNTLGGICEEVGTWPHDKVKAAMKDLYGFTSDYPPFRHGGTPGHNLRDVDMRDLIAISIILTGFMPYLSNNLNADQVYRRA